MARKKKDLPLLEGIEITDVAAEGKAMARVDDLVVFVPYVVPGDVVDIQLTRKKHNYEVYYFQIVKHIYYLPLILKAAAGRQRPFCL